MPPLPGRERSPGHATDRLLGWPHPPAPTALLAAIVAVVVALVGVRAAGFAFAAVGLTPTWAVLVLVGSLLGSAVNLPVLSVEADLPEVGYLWVRRGRLLYSVPYARRGRVVVAVNVGGAVIPTVVSVYLLARTGAWWQGLLTVALVAAVVHLFATPAPGIGIVVPMFVPAVTAATVALLVATARADVSALAYVGGTVGTLVGADLTNLSWLRRLPARVVSIGGGGTFDGVFVSGILAVLLAALV